MRNYLQQGEESPNHREAATMLAEFTAAFGSPDALEASQMPSSAASGQHRPPGVSSHLCDYNRTP
jgi:hypothetical protein